MTTATIEKCSTEELINICIDNFYEELATSTKCYFLDTVREENQIRPRTRLEKRLKRIEEIKEGLNQYEEKQAKATTEEQKEWYQNAILIYRNRLDYEKNPTIERQKQEYEKTQDVFTSHSYTEFPLTGKISPIYENVNCVVVYFDNLTTEKMVSKLENASTLEEKKQIVKDNVEITHMVIREATCSRKCIALRGKIDGEYSDPSNPHTNCLPPKYADWANLTEADCEEIANKELKEYVLNKIK